MILENVPMTQGFVVRGESPGCRLISTAYPMTQAEGLHTYVTNVKSFIQGQNTHNISFLVYVSV